MNNLFQILFGGNIKKKKNCNLTNSSIKRFARKAGIMYLPKNTYDNIRKIFNNKFKKTLSELENITELRNGKIITSNDFQFYILKKKYEKLYNKYHNSNFIGGNDNPSYCDGPTNLTQCMDSLDTCNTLNGGSDNPSYCDGPTNLTQCMDSLDTCNTLNGGSNNPSYCDGPTNLTQCMDSLDTCNTLNGGSDNPSYCDGPTNLTQCMDSLDTCNTLNGGSNNPSYCDGPTNLTQCMDSLDTCNTLNGGSDNPSYCDGPTNLTQCIDSLDTCNTQRGGQSTKNKDLNFLFPHKTFKRYLKEYKNTDFKISNKFAIKLHLYLENYIHHTLVKASLLENKSKNLKISLDKFL